MGVSKNNGTPKSSILIGFSIINHPFWGIPIFGNTHMIFCWRLEKTRLARNQNFTEACHAKAMDQLDDLATGDAAKLQVSWTD